MNIRKIISVSLFILVGLPMTILNGSQVINSLFKPQLVYWVDIQQVPISVRNGAINYYIKTLYFQNTGYKTANNLRVEITTPIQFQQATPEVCIANGVTPNVILQEGSKEGEILINTAKTQYTQWGEVFQGELEEYPSLADFKNKRKEGPAIIRKSNENIVVAYKERFHASQRGYIKMSSFVDEPKITKVLFETDEAEGKEKTALSIFDKLFTNKIFLMFIGLLLIVGALIQAFNASAKK